MDAVGASDEGRGAVAGSMESDRSATASDADSARVFVYGLTDKVMERHVDEIFGFYGRIRRLKIHNSASKLSLCMLIAESLPKRSASIEYSSPLDVDDAIEHMHDGQIDGVRIRVSRTEEREEPREVRRPPPRRTEDTTHRDDRRDARGWGRRDAQLGNGHYRSDERHERRSPPHSGSWERHRSRSRSPAREYRVREEPAR